MILNDDCLTRVLMLSLAPPPPPWSMERGGTGLSVGNEGNRVGDKIEVAVGLDNDNKVDKGILEEKAVGVEKAPPRLSADDFMLFCCCSGRCFSKCIEACCWWWVLV